MFQNLKSKTAALVAVPAAALVASPGFFPARYNIGALLALRGQWEPATSYFRELRAERPGNELVEYKLLLLLLAHGKVSPQDALFMSQTPSNTPAWYYAAAARAYARGDRKTAKSYIEVAKNLFGEKTSIFQEELEESGLMNSRK